MTHRSVERWRAITGVDGYEVSDQGRVRSLDRTVRFIRGGREIRSRLKGRVLKPSIDSNANFVGLKPEGKEALHRNGDKRDASLKNLRWGTHSENMRDMNAHQTHPLRKLDARKASSIRGSALSAEELATIYGVDRRTINRIKAREIWV